METIHFPDDPRPPWLVHPVLALGRPEMHLTFPRLWHSHKPQEIPLKGLSKKACERLIQQVLGSQVPPAVVARAVEHAAGNALFLEETVRLVNSTCFCPR